MAPEIKIRAARVLIPVGLVLAVVAAIIGSWVLVAALALLVVSQVINLRASLRQLGGHDSR